MTRQIRNVVHNQQEDVSSKELWYRADPASAHERVIGRSLRVVRMEQLRDKSRSHITLRWALCISLIVSLSPVGGTVFAQEFYPLQGMLEGLWEPGRGDGSSENLLDLEVEALLTAEAEDFRRRWAIEESDDAALCQRRSAAAHTGFGYTLEFLSKDGVIYMIGFEQIRRVYMDGRDRPNDFWPNKLGWSEGQWEGDTLVVRTNDFTQGTIDSGDRPLPFGGPDAEMIERYTLSEDATRLSLQVFRNDPKYYIAPINMRQEFTRSDRTISTIDCVPSIY